MGRQSVCAFVVCLLTAVAACGSDKDKEKLVGPDPEALAQSEEIASAEADLLGKRDELFQMRTDLVEKREALNEERAVVREKGGDLSVLDARSRELLEEERKLTQAERDLDRKLQEILNQRREIIDALAAAGSAGNDESSRDAVLARRERAIADRERAIADREAAVSRREENLATKWKDSCAASIAAVPTTTIIQSSPVGGTRYTKKDVEPLLERARRDMSKLGILVSDLPVQARELEKEANIAMKEGDFGRARLAADQLVGTVRGIRIDKGFIAAKIQRLNAAMKGKKLSREIEDLFREVTAMYGDAKFSQANKKLNAIYSSL